MTENAVQRDQNITVKTSAPIKGALQQLAADERRTVSLMVEILIIEELRRRNRLPPDAFG
jgi:hypothetical protein